MPETLYPAQETVNYTAASWSVADDNAKNHVAPIDADSDRFTANSAGGAAGTITIDADQAAVELAGLNMTGFLGTLADALIPAASKGLDIDGNVILDGKIVETNDLYFEVQGNLTLTSGMTFTPAANGLPITLNGTGNVTTNGITLGTLISNGAATHTTVGALSCGKLTMTLGTLVLGAAASVGTGGFTFTNGTFNMASFGITVTGGNVAYTAGTLSNSGTWTLGGTANLAWNAATQQLGSLVLAASAVITRTAAVYAKALTVPATANLAGAQTFYLQLPSADDCIELLGTIGAGNILCRYDSARANSKQILCPSTPLYFSGITNDATWTQTAKVQTSALTVRTETGNKTATLTFSGGGCGNLGNIGLGTAAQNTRHATLNLGGGWFTMASLVANAAATYNVGLGSSYIEITGGGTLNFTGMTVTATAGACHIEGRGTGTISNCSPAQVVHAHNCVNGGGNGANLLFDVHTPPGSMTMMGVGI